MPSGVLTLIATPPHPPLESKRIQAVVDALCRAGARTNPPDWLEPGAAADVPFDGLPLALAAEAAGIALEGAAVDAIAQPVSSRRKALLVADMDSTIIEQECLDELAAAVGLRDEIARITERAMRGEMDFVTALRERVGKLAGLPVSALEQTRARLTFMPGARQLVGTMRAHGAQCHLVSGGFRFFTRHVAQSLGFHADHANEFVIRDGCLSGAVAEPVLDKEAKLQTLRKLTADLTLDPLLTLAVGDGANDLPMLGAAGLGVAYHAKPAVNDAAPARVRYSDLTALLYAQGYRKKDFRA